MSTLNQEVRPVINVTEERGMAKFHPGIHDVLVLDAIYQPIGESIDGTLDKDGNVRVYDADFMKLTLECLHTHQGEDSAGITTTTHIFNTLAKYDSNTDEQNAKATERKYSRLYHIMCNMQEVDEYTPNVETKKIATMSIKDKLAARKSPATADAAKALIKSKFFTSGDFETTAKALVAAEHCIGKVVRMKFVAKNGKPCDLCNDNFKIVEYVTKPVELQFNPEVEGVTADKLANTVEGGLPAYPSDLNGQTDLNKPADPSASAEAYPSFILE